MYVFFKALCLVAVLLSGRALPFLTSASLAKKLQIKVAFMYAGYEKVYGLEKRGAFLSFSSRRTHRFLLLASPPMFFAHAYFLTSIRAFCKKEATLEASRYGLHQYHYMRDYFTTRLVHQNYHSQARSSIT